MLLNEKVQLTMKVLFLFNLFTFIFMSCSTSRVYHPPFDMYITSSYNENYNPDKAQSVYVQKPESNNIIEIKVFDLLENELIQNGFKVVDSMNHADFLLTYKYDLNINYVDSSNSVKQNSYYGTFTEKYEDQMNRFGFLVIILLDKKSNDADKYQTVWESFLYTEPEYFERFTSVTIKELLQGYGRSFLRPGFFPKK
ncbi:MAG: hypothetical protein DWP97_14250 [Calditrichaeota bacterium]|nr:MAG: hypothetical protein DWP97_14250 [Calditrichota bacterium]